MQLWQQQRDQNIAARDAAIATIAAERRQDSAVKSDRTLPQDESRYTPLQLELFAVNSADFDRIEARLAKLPRQRQREHFRKLYLNAYYSVKDDGSLAFELGNEQRRYANNYLREVLDVRLKKALQAQRVNVSYLLAFRHTPNWLQNIELEIKTETEINRQQGEWFWESFAPKFAAFTKQQQQEANLPFYLITESKLKKIAFHLAASFQAYQYDFIEKIAVNSTALSDDEVNACIFDLYQKCGQSCQAIGFPIPHWARLEQGKKIKGEQIDIALNKIVCEKYWLRTMRTVQRRMIEHIAIACGEVRKQASSYISYGGFNEWAQKIRKNYDYLKAMVVQNIDDPEEQYELFEMFKKSSSYPAIRRNEMMCRLRGIEEWADENYNEALFLTLTAPSAFHAARSIGDMNDKWDGASPRHTQAYLRTVWAQYRALLAKRKIRFHGMRVAEPHHDGTPHWHILMYVKAEHKAEVIRLFKLKALELNGDEQGAMKHRCRVEECDKSKGSATAYITKYVSKNIDGFAAPGEMSDEVPNLSLQDNAKRVRAWASMWGIRQFQFFGGASVSVWRELRRLVAGQCEDEIIEKARIVADVSCFASYVEIQGGAFAIRKDQPIKLDYLLHEANKYGEQRKSIQGLANRFSLKNVISRTKRYIIKKGDPNSHETRQIEKPTSSDLDLAAQRAARNSGLCPPWTCVSNCNRHKGDLSATDIRDFINSHHDEIEQINFWLNFHRIPSRWITDYRLCRLVMGDTVGIFGGMSARWDGHELVIN